MSHRSPLVHRLAASLALLLQLLLQTGIAWQDARAEGEGLRRHAHVESLGALHGQVAHAPDCAVSQHLQAHSAPAARLRTAVAPAAASPARPSRSESTSTAALAGGTSSRGPPRAA